MIFRRIIYVVTFVFLSISAFPQSSPDSLHLKLNKKRLAFVAGSEVGLTAVSMTGLYYLWFADYPMSKFHFFNDNAEWLQMDKMGHSFSAYYLGKMGYESMRWTGLNKKKSLLYGGTFGFLYLGVIEILDGFSVGWGASPGDLVANTSGTLIFIGQQALWDEQKIQLKFSYFPSSYAAYRPTLLGSNFQERLLKDYNGQNYWLSFNLKAFGWKKAPSWLSLSLGYGANGMIGGHNNPLADDNGDYLYFPRYRQFYLSPDIDLSRIKTKNKILNTALNTFGFFKIPFPGLEFSNGRLYGRWLVY